jgi:hypothetical protein
VQSGRGDGRRTAFKTCCAGRPNHGRVPLMRGRITHDSQGLCSPHGQYCGGDSPENGEIAAKPAVMPAI